MCTATTTRKERRGKARRNTILETYDRALDGQRRPLSWLFVIFPGLFFVPIMAVGESRAGMFLWCCLGSLSVFSSRGSVSIPFRYILSGIWCLFFNPSPFCYLFTRCVSKVRASFIPNSWRRDTDIASRLMTLVCAFSWLSLGLLISCQRLQSIVSTRPFG